MICIWFFPSFFPLFTILLDLEFVRFWGCCVGFNSWKDIRWTPCQVNQADSSWARFFTLGRISWENPTSLDGYSDLHHFQSFWGLILWGYHLIHLRIISTEFGNFWRRSNFGFLGRILGTWADRGNRPGRLSQPARLVLRWPTGLPDGHRICMLNNTSIHVNRAKRM